MKPSMQAKTRFRRRRRWQGQGQHQDKTKNDIPYRLFPVIVLFLLINTLLDTIQIKGVHAVALPSTSDKNPQQQQSSSSTSATASSTTSNGNNVGDNPSNKDAKNDATTTAGVVVDDHHDQNNGKPCEETTTTTTHTPQTATTINDGDGGSGSTSPGNTFGIGQQISPQKHQQQQLPTTSLDDADTTKGDETIDEQVGDNNNIQQHQPSSAHENIEISISGAGFGSDASNATTRMQNVNNDDRRQQRQERQQSEENGDEESNSSRSSRSNTIEGYDDRTLLDVFGEVAKEYLTQKVIPPTDVECRWDWRSIRCEPACECMFEYQTGDYHLGRSCRLRPNDALDTTCQPIDPARLFRDNPVTRRFLSLVGQTAQIVHEKTFQRIGGGGGGENNHDRTRQSRQRRGTLENNPLLTRFSKFQTELCKDVWTLHKEAPPCFQSESDIPHRSIQERIFCGPIDFHLCSITDDDDDNDDGKDDSDDSGNGFGNNQFPPRPRTWADLS